MIQKCLDMERTVFQLWEPENKVQRLTLTRKRNTSSAQKMFQYGWIWMQMLPCRNGNRRIFLKSHIVLLVTLNFKYKEF